MSQVLFHIKNDRIFFVFLVLVLTSSCKKDDQINNFGTRVSFDISYQLLKGKHIDCIATDNKGNVFIASDTEIYYAANGDLKEYSIGLPVLDMAIAPDGSLWIATHGGGLGHFDGKVFTWYSMDNVGLPRDLISKVKVAPDGKVWFSCSAYKLGGLGVFDGNHFEIFTPENSPLNQNIIDDIEIGSDGTVYIATAGTVGCSNIYSIKGKTWDCLGDEKGTFYWVFSFAASQSGLLYVVEDFSLSSSSFNTNKLYQLNDNKWQKIEIDFELGFFTRMNFDKRDYLWVAGRGENSPVLHVYNGKSWVSSPNDLFSDEYVTAIATDYENNVWIGTYDNGVYILKQ
jgi:ligand-binding sensor domain-containing protein